MHLHSELNVVQFYRFIGRGTVYIRYVLRVKGCSLTVWLLLGPFVYVRSRGSVSVGVNGIEWPLGGCGCGGVLWLVGFQKRVKDLVGRDSRVIVQVVTVCVFRVSVEAFYSV
jgi:hypothetical protein